MEQVRNEIYDNNGLVRVEFVDMKKGPTKEELIATKESNLLTMYEELRVLRGEII